MRLDVGINRTGCIGSLRVRHGEEPLDLAALDAVVRWRYAPTLLDGRPLPVVMTVTVNFRR